jgi:uncharacterized membrane protein
MGREKAKRVLSTLLSAAGAICTLGLAKTASATLTVCNDSSTDVFFETTRNGATQCGSSSPFQSDGWFVIPRCSCRDVVGGSVKNLNFWFSAVSTTNSSVVWTGNGSNVWPVEWSAHDMCFTPMVNFCNSNPLDACDQNVSHIGAAAAWTNAVLVLHDFRQLRWDQRCTDKPPPPGQDVIACSELGPQCR